MTVKTRDERAMDALVDWKPTHVIKIGSDYEECIVKGRAQKPASKGASKALVNSTTTTYMPPIFEFIYLLEFRNGNVMWMGSVRENIFTIDDNYSFEAWGIV